MTLKYESEILFDLMKRDGDDTPSDVLPYESELKEKYLEQVEGAYPKLQDYRSEWLNYNLNAHLPADFPVETLSNVTGATVDNVVPYAYGSAILKGQTKYRDIDTGEFLDTFDETKNLELVSVKMPVLTTQGKNLFDIDNVIRQEGVIIKDNSIHITENRNYTGDPIYTFENTPTESVLTFDLSSNDVQSPGGALASIQYEDGTNAWITTTKNVYVNTKKITDIKIHNWCKGTHIFSNIQLEEGTQVSSFEPYKSNILSTPEDLELHGIGNVKDTLDCLTGEVSQNLIEFEFNDGNYFSNAFTEYENTIRWQTPTSIRQLLQLKTGGKILSANLVTDNSNNDYEHIRIDGAVPYGNVVIYLSKTKASTYEELKTYIKNNPFTIIAEKVEKSIKTVDLTVTDQDGNIESIIRPIEGTMHVSTSSQTLPPLLDMSVPVEATSQNLMSFANIVEEE